MDRLTGLEPKEVFRYFEEICGIPHGSGNTKAISDYLVSEAKKLGLEYGQDDMGNVLIRKPAYPGYENQSPVILQGHMDMVCEKRQDLAHDFEKDGLNLGITDGYIHASGTTLGGDDGIAVAMMLALLEDKTAKHPALEALFTVDEEIGLLGAAGFDTDILKGKRMINLDSEEEGDLWVSCAGGLTGITHLPVTYEAREGRKVNVKVCGLMGGHSGAEIDKGRASACKIMAGLLLRMEKELSFTPAIIYVGGGSKDNAIPRECTASLLLSEESQLQEIEDVVRLYEEEKRKEYTGTDEGIRIITEPSLWGEEKILTPASRTIVLFYLNQMPFGIQKMSGTIPGLVETSLNPGIVRLDQEELYVSYGIRSSVNAAKEELSDKVAFLTEFLGGEYETQGRYPAWEYREESELRNVMQKVYSDLFGGELKVVAMHAGLECGIFYQKIENLDCVSIGPEILDIHTSEERMNIASVQRTYRFLKEVLRVLS
ncbi:MAG: aminoacyl-histidine dipeptidase [Blautia sp.]|nr:aminoacyl-histidine dipeptidase [Blautia sp.]